MKKASLFILALIMLILPLPAMIHFPGEMSYDDKAWLIDVFHSAYMGRDDAEITVESLEEKDGLVTLSFLMEGEPRLITAPSREALKDFTARALYQEKELFLSPDALFFVDDGVIASHTSFLPGRLAEAYDRQGNTRGLLMTREAEDGVNLFSAWHSMDLLPGLSLRKGPVCSLDFALSTPFTRGDFSAAVTARNLVGFDNLFFKGGVRYTMGGGRNGWHASLGMEARAGLSALSDSTFTMVEDAAVFASAELLLGWMDGFSVGGAYSVGYEHLPLPTMYWRIGLETSSLMKYRPALMISGGVFI